MQTRYDQEIIQKSMLSQNTTGFGKLMSNHWVLFWFDPATKQYVAYEAKDPLRCYASVADKHKDYEFALIQAVPNLNVANEIIRALRTVNTITPELEANLSAHRVARTK